MRAGGARAQVAEIQRARLVGAAAGVVDERGYAQTTVGLITARSRVSRRTFYDLFENVEDCFLAVVRDILETVEHQLNPVELSGLVWRERVRLGFWRILCFFDAEPALARVLVVHSLKGGAAVAAERERALARLAAVVDEGRGERGGGGLSVLSAEGAVGAALAIVQARLARGERSGALSGLLGELSAIVVLPYLGAAAARRELARPLPERPPVRAAHESNGAVSAHAANPLDGVPMRLTYRTARVLEGIGTHPGASNRQIADLAGIADQGQISKLLRRLERLGLLLNTGQGAHNRGEPNAWVLTPQGEQITHSFRAHTTTTHKNAT